MPVFASVRPWPARTLTRTRPGNLYPYQFPRNAILDSFTRADENPLAGGWLGPIEAAQPQLKIVSNQAQDVGASYGLSYWSTTQFGANQEAFVDVPTLPASAGLGVWCRVQNPGNAATAAGYLAILHPGGASPGLDLFRLTAGHTYTSIIPPGVTQRRTIASGDGIGLSVIDTRLYVWHRSGATGSWGLVVTVNDATISGPGYIGLEIDTTAGIADNFGGGEIPAVTAASATVNSVVGTLTLSADTSAVQEAVAPAVGTLSFLGNTQTVAEALQQVVGTLTLVGNTQAPRISMAETIGTLTLSGIAPTLSITTDVTVNQVVGVLNLVGNAPTPKIDLLQVIGTLTLSGNTQALRTALAPSIGTLTLAGNTQQVALALSETPGVLNLLGNVQNVSDRSINATTGVLLLRGDAPTLSGAVSAAGDTSVQLWLYFIN